jgi:hypothetical protein
MVVNNVLRIMKKHKERNLRASLGLRFDSTIDSLFSKIVSGGFRCLRNDSGKRLEDIGSRWKKLLSNDTKSLKIQGKMLKNIEYEKREIIYPISFALSLLYCISAALGTIS